MRAPWSRARFLRGRFWASALLIALVLCGWRADAAGRVAWVAEDDLGDFGAGLESAMETEFKRRGVKTVRVKLEGTLAEEGMSPREIRRIAFDSEADGVVVGRAVPWSEGEGVEYSLTAYSGQSGVRLGTRTESLPDLDRDPVAARLWASWVTSVLTLPDRRAPLVEREVGSAEAVPGAGGLDELLRFRGPEKGAPLKIDAETLEVLGMDDRTRRIRFRGNVRAELGEMVLWANELEAFYRSGDSEPERLIAEGEVRIDQGEREAFCQRAEYSRLRDQVTCMGDAVLIHGCDRVRGERIELELGRDRARVEGAASVVIVPEDSDAGRACAKGKR